MEAQEPTEANFPIVKASIDFSPQKTALYSRTSADASPVNWHIENRLAFHGKRFALNSRHVTRDANIRAEPGRRHILEPNALLR